MVGLPSDFQERVIKALSDKGVSSPCPRCNNRNFSVLQGMFLNQVQTETGTVRIGGPSVPTAVVICNHCGFVSQYALGALGIAVAGKEPQK